MRKLKLIKVTVPEIVAHLAEERDHGIRGV